MKKIFQAVMDSVGNQFNKGSARKTAANFLNQAPAKPIVKPRPVPPKK